MAKLSFSEKLKKLFTGATSQSEEFFEDLTDALIEGDVGAKNAVEIVDELEKKCRSEKITDSGEITKILESMILPYVKSIDLKIEKNKTNVCFAQIKTKSRLIFIYQSGNYYKVLNSFNRFSTSYALFKFASSSFE